MEEEDRVYDKAKIQALSRQATAATGSVASSHTGNLDDETHLTA